MTNLTGEYDVVVEVGVGLLNGVLGAVHANQDRDYPTMPHSLNLFIDDGHRGALDPIPESQRTGVRSRVEVQVSTPTVSLPVDTIVVQPEMGMVGGPRIARRSAPATADAALDVDAAEDPAVAVLPGIRWPPIWFPSPMLRASVRLRAWVRDATDPSLPDFIDGELFVSTALVRSEVLGVGTFITLDRTSGPMVSFQPAAGTAVTAEQAQVIASLVRNFIRGEMDPATFRVRLPSEVRHFDFALQPEAHRPCVQLMLTLDGPTPGPGARSSAAPGLLSDAGGFAVGVGRDFITRALGSRLFQGVPDRYHYSKYGVSATVRPDWAAAGFDLEAGRIVFSLRGDGDISWWGVDDHFTFSVRQAFGLEVSGNGLMPVALGDPEVDLDDVAVGGGYIEGKAKATIKQERDAALLANAAALRRMFEVGRQVETILAGIHPGPPGVTLSSVTIRPDGVVVQGRVGLAASGPAVASQTGRGGFGDALASWIPGGTVDRYVWERYPSSPPLVRVEDHRFVTEAITGRMLGGICLRVEGTRVTAGGGVAPVSGSACFPFMPVLGPIDDLAAELPRPVLPLTEPDGDGGVRVVGHYDPWAHGRAPAGAHASLLVHFASDPDEALALLDEALGDRRGGGVVAIAVVAPPAGAAARGLPATDHVLVADDPDGRWADTFGITRTPATVLVGPGGDVVWRSETAVTAKQLASALAKHARDGGEVEVVPMTPGVRPNDRPPEIPLALADGSELSMRRLGGRPVVLVFWTSRSPRSIESLEELRGLGSSTAVVAVGDGETQERIAEVLGDRTYPFAVVADPDRRLSRRFGVWCWPTTVWVRPDQRIEAVDLGAVATGRPTTGSGGVRQEEHQPAV